MRHSSTSRRSTGVTLVGPALTALASAGALAGALALCTPPLAELHGRVAQGEPWSTLPFGLLVTSLAAAVLAVSALWTAAVTVGIVVEVLTGASSALVRAVTPALVRRAVLVCCGLAVGSAGAVSPAAADPPAHTEEAAGVTAHGTGAALAGLPLPDRALGGAAPLGQQPHDRASGRQVATRRAAAGGAASVPTRPALADRGSTAPAQWPVQRGDSLWSIAEALLPTAAGPAELDAAWRRIYRANRSVIGDDPDLLVPGTTLRLPHTAWPQAADHPRKTRPEPGPTTPRKDAS